MASVVGTLCYRLADTLAMRLRYDAKGNCLTGSKRVEVDGGPVRLPYDVEIVESALSPVKHSVIAKIAGNLHVLVSATQKRTRVYVLDYAKLEGEQTKLLKRTYDALEHKVIMRVLGKAVAAVYESDGISIAHWHEVKGKEA